jgi:chondroitin 4-sulfotransferase 11
MTKHIYFIHVPKVAGLFIKNFFTEDLQIPYSYTPDIEDAGTPDERKFIADLGHVPLFKIDRTKFFVFGFVRNPWDRLVSAYFYMKKGGQPGNRDDKKSYEKYFKYNKSFEEFVDHFYENRSFYFQQNHLKTQSYYLQNKNVIDLDFLGKYEDLYRDMNNLLVKLNIKSKVNIEEIPEKNISIHNHYKKYYNAEMVRKVAELYRADAKNFNYSFD